MLLLLIPQLLFLLFILVLNGEPFRFFLSRRLRFLSSLDLIQAVVLDVYLGGFFLYAVAMLPLQLFSWPIVFGLTAALSILAAAVHFKTLTSLFRLSRIRAFLTQDTKKTVGRLVSLIRERKEVVDHAIVFGMFLVFLFINLVSVSNFVYGSVRDESIHSLSVEVILENRQVPVTLQPYLAEGIIYPQASHVIFAFASYLLNMEVPEAVFYVSILFKSLSVLAAYFLGKKLSSRRTYYLGLTFVFAFVSSWPLYVTWGGNPFLVGFPLFLVSLGLLFPMVREHGEYSLFELVAVGLLFGYCAAMIISFLETLVAAAVLIVIYWIIMKRTNLRRGLLGLMAVFLISLIPLSPFLFRFFAFYQYPGHNLGIPSDFSQWPRPQIYPTQALQWMFENLSPYTWLSALIVFLLFSFAALVWKARSRDVKLQTDFSAIVFIAAALLSFISFLLPLDFNVISWGHQGIILIVPINMAIIALYVKILDLCCEVDIKSLSKLFSKGAYSSILAAFLILLLVNVPFLYGRFAMDPSVLSGAYGLYAITTEGDRDLMHWMKANLTSNAVVLVNPSDAGLFIPSVSHHKIIFPWGGSSYTVSYQTLVNLTLNHILNSTTYELLQSYGVSHVFVGAAATGWWAGDFRWDPDLFLGNPNFNLTENFGHAYLFQFDYSNPNVVFSDDFEHAEWSTNGWQAYSQGAGDGNVTLKPDFGYQSQSSLRITAQAAFTASQWQYATYVSKKIFTLNGSDVSLSFYVNATQGFSGRDTFAAIVSNLYGNRTLVITTPNGVYENYRNSYTIGSPGFYEFKGNQSLSSLWRQAYNSPMPNPFILQFVNWDLDGVQNVAYLDNVTVEMTPSG